MKLIRPITARPVNSAPDSDARNSGFLNRFELEDRLALAELDRDKRGEQDHSGCERNDRPRARTSSGGLRSARRSGPPSRGRGRPRPRDRAERRVEARDSSIPAAATTSDGRGDGLEPEAAAPAEPCRERAGGERSDRDAGPDRGAPHAGGERAPMTGVESVPDRSKRCRQHARARRPPAGSGRR